MARTQEAANGSNAVLNKLKKQFEDFASLKTAEHGEQRQGRLYYHGSHWTKEQLAELKKRGQPPTSTPVFARKINGFVGLVERLRQDPKAYPRTPQEDQGAELCTAALRYVMEQQDWVTKSTMVTLHGAVEGLGGIELGLEPGDSGVEGDYDVSIEYVDPDVFFYDPRSFRPDFSDARYMGVARWLDVEDAKARFPDKADELDSRLGAGEEFTFDTDRGMKWVNTAQKQLVIVEHWYKKGDEWHWAYYTSGLMLQEGQSPYQDEKGKDFCRFIMWSSFVDQDGDRYGFLRNMKSLVDEINQRGSKALHLLSMRRIIMEQGAVEDVEVLRREAVRPDGVIVHQPGLVLTFEDAKTLADMQGQLAMRESARQELENFGPNPALVGQTKATSGRDRELMQQAGLAELGPFLISRKGWTIRVYRSVWNILKNRWTAERWIRVTDAEGVQQPIQINGQQPDPATGMMVKVNEIGALDVDIIIDEGPDVVNMMSDTLEALQSVAAKGTPVPPEVVIELMPLPDSMKKRLVGMMQQAQEPPPGAQEAMQIELAQGAAKVEETKASAILKMSQASAAQRPEQPSAPDQGMSGPEVMELFARIDEIKANTILKLSQAEKTSVETQLAPQQMAQKAESDRMRADQMRQRASVGA